jgi:diguanylate cyclase (GGDEF)-like protein
LEPSSGWVTRNRPAGAETNNDLRGHPSGDAVLAALGPLLVSQTRQMDLAGRWGGEEFVVALTGPTRPGDWSAQNEFAWRWQG